MTASSTTLRAGEMAIQDEFQRDLEFGLAYRGRHQKVMVWNHVHDALREDLAGRTKRPLVVMNSLDRTNDRAMGVNRKDIFVNVWGLVEAIEEINACAFQAWLTAHPDVRLSVRDLAQVAATHLANLFESTAHGPRTNTWRMLLALGEKHAWERMAKSFGFKQDPRFLRPQDIPGTQGTEAPLHYRPCYTNSESPRAFLDLVPSWLDEIAGKHAAKAKEEAHRLVEAVKAGSLSSNRHAWVREFPIGLVSGQREYADFALLINGLPIVLVEIKPPAVGIKNAIRDFQKKPTYQGSPLCVAGDGCQLIMTSIMEGNLEAWAHYAHNTGNRVLPHNPADPLDSSRYVLQELLSRPDRLEFFLRHCGSINEDGLYMVGRSQQYQAVSKLGRDLAWVDVCNGVLTAAGEEPVSVGNRLIRQTQRTGKTHTLVRCVHLALGTHPEQFRLANIMVGEILILGQIQADLEDKDLGLSDSSLKIHRIESRSQLNRALAQESDPNHRSEGRVLLVNMQKISPKDSGNVSLEDSHRTLVVVDEGHLAQTGTTADVRDLIFPNASHLLLTATPKSSMAQRYGITKDFHVLDDFGYNLAHKAGMVCPVVFKRRPYVFSDDPLRISQIAQAVSQSLKGSVTLAEVSSVLGQVMSGELSALDDENNLQASHARALARHLHRQIEREFIRERLDAVVDELLLYQDHLEKSDQGQPIFRPRALAFLRDTESAMDIIRYIWVANGFWVEVNTPGQPTRYKENLAMPPNQRNVYRGLRFALDVSDFGKDPSGELRSFTHFNPGIPDESALKSRMKHTDPDIAVDVLLAVGKYTKGYNNDQLAVVALLRNVGEPSLINQIYTRPATMRHGKPKGVCLDLAFGRGNVECWNESMRLYDCQVDLDQLYTEEKISDLVSQVALKLESTAKALGLDTSKLADYSQAVAAIESMDDEQKKKQGRAFILGARGVVDLIAKMPDSSIYGHLRAPLVGLKLSLSKIQWMYPDLVESTDVNADGTINAGHTDKSLGDIIRHALSVLGQSSLKTLFDIRMASSIEVVPTQREDAVTQARQRQALQSSKTAIERITGRNAQAKESEAGPESEEPRSARGMRAQSALMDSLNRILDKLRDDYAPEQGRESLYADRLLEAGEAIDAAMNELSRNGGELRHFLAQRLEDLLDERARALDLDLLHCSVTEELGLVVNEAATDMANDYQEWHRGLSAHWADQSPHRLAQAWKGQYAPRNLTDFFGNASKRQDIHGLKSDGWIAQLSFKSMTNQRQIKALVGSAQDDPRTLSLPALIDFSMELALGDMEALKAAEDWRKALAGEATRAETRA